jgi:hypothetical protein
MEITGKCPAANLMLFEPHCSKEVRVRVGCVPNHPPRYVSLVSFTTRAVVVGAEVALQK